MRSPLMGITGKRLAVLICLALWPSLAAGCTVEGPPPATPTPAPRVVYPHPHGAPPPVACRHFVRPGDTLSSIARSYGTSVGAIAAANHLPNPNRIRVGQVLYIPGPRCAAADP